MLNISRKTSWVYPIFLCILAQLFISCNSTRKNDEFHTASCANHLKQFELSFLMLAHEKPDFTLPTEADTRKAMHQIFVENGIFDDKWLNCSLSSCPESYCRDKSIGYVYIGDGLKLKDVIEKGIPIFFCPGENHRGYSEHCHCYLPLGVQYSVCVFNNSKMIEILEDALKKGENGEIPYSKRALEVLKKEIEKRKTK